MIDVVLSADAARRLMALLEQIHKDSRASDLLLCTPSGTQGAESGTFPGPDPSIFCALAAAAWSSTASMAQMIGEPGFRAINHVGHNTQIHLVPVDQRSLLIFLFGQEQLPQEFHAQAAQWAATVQAEFSQMGGTSQVSSRR